MSNNFQKVLSFDDISILPLDKSEIRSRNDVSLKKTFGQKTGRYVFDLTLPLFGSPMTSVVGPKMADALANYGAMGVIHRYNTINEQIELIQQCKVDHARISGAIGATGDYLERAICLRNQGVRCITIDTANGFSVMVEESIKKLLSHPTLQDCYFLVGNVATYQGAKFLDDLGIDGIRANIGSGSACTTRVVTGIGQPCLQTILDLRDTLPVYSILADVIGDGGVRGSGDAVKCFVAGADAVMCGSLLAATDETPGPEIHRDGVTYKEYFGMASSKAVNNWDSKKFYPSPEGVEHLIPTKGPTKDVLDTFAWGIKSGLSYLNVQDIVNAKDSGRFVILSNAGLIESHPHIKNQ